MRQRYQDLRVPRLNCLGGGVCVVTNMVLSQKLEDVTLSIYFVDLIVLINCFHTWLRVLFNCHALRDEMLGPSPRIS